VHLFAFNLEELPKVSLGAPTYSLYLPFDKLVHYCAFSLSVNIIDQEVFVRLLDVVDLASEYKCIWQVLHSFRRQRE